MNAKALADIIVNNQNNLSDIFVLIKKYSLKHF